MDFNGLDTATLGNERASMANRIRVLSRIVSKLEIEQSHAAMSRYGLIKETAGTNQQFRKAILEIKQAIERYRLCSETIGDEITRRTEPQWIRFEVEKIDDEAYAVLGYQWGSPTTNHLMSNHYGHDAERAAHHALRFLEVTHGV